MPEASIIVARRRPRRPEPMQVAFKLPKPLARSFARALCQRKSLNSLFTSPHRPLSFNPRSNFFAAPRAFSTTLLRRQQQQPARRDEKDEDGSVATSSSGKPSIRENIYTIPNFLTASRILACPVLGWSILDSNYELATGLLVYAGLTDLVRDFFSMHSSGKVCLLLFEDRRIPRSKV